MIRGQVALKTPGLAGIPIVNTRAYAAEHGGITDALAAIAVKNRAFATDNPDAQFRGLAAGGGDAGVAADAGDGAADGLRGDGVVELRGLVDHGERRADHVFATRAPRVGLGAGGELVADLGNRTGPVVGKDDSRLRGADQTGRANRADTAVVPE